MLTVESTSVESAAEDPGLWQGKDLDEKGQRSVTCATPSPRLDRNPTGERAVSRPPWFPSVISAVPGIYLAKQILLEHELIKSDIFQPIFTDVFTHI